MMHHSDSPQVLDLPIKHKKKKRQAEEANQTEYVPTSELPTVCDESLESPIKKRKKSKKPKEQNSEQFEEVSVESTFKQKKKRKHKDNLTSTSTFPSGEQQADEVSQESIVTEDTAQAHDHKRNAVLKSLDTPEEIAKYREERKKNFPTRANTTRKVPNDAPLEAPVKKQKKIKQKEQSLIEAKPIELPTEQIEKAPKKPKKPQRVPSESPPSLQEANTVPKQKKNKQSVLRTPRKVTPSIDLENFQFSFLAWTKLLCPNHSDAHDVPPPSTYLQQLFPDSQIDINTFGEGKKCYAQITVNQRIQFMDYYFYEDEATAQEAAALYVLKKLQPITLRQLVKEYRDQH